MSYQSKFADALRNAMEEQKVSQAMLARLTGLNSGTISRVLSCKVHVSYNTVARIAKQMNLWKGRMPEDLAKYLEQLAAELAYEKTQAHKLSIVNKSLIILLIISIVLGLI